MMASTVDYDLLKSGIKPRIVISGVNLTEAGPLSVFRDALESVASEYSGRYEIIAIVHRRDLFHTQLVTYVEYPRVKSSWLRRLDFEYRILKRLSLQLKPAVWLSMHDMTPNVSADVRAVYCHNPSPFYPFRLSEAVLDWKFGLFMTFYRFLYGINIHSNNFVVVQQDWMRRSFMRIYGVRNVVVAHPALNDLGRHPRASVDEDGDRPYRFFYPAFPRTFKNHELSLKAVRILEQRAFGNFELWLTVAASVNKYAAKLVNDFRDLSSVRWLGLLSREQVFDLYGPSGRRMARRSDLNR